VLRQWFQLVVVIPTRSAFESSGSTPFECASRATFVVLTDLMERYL